jgi:hypothetical protein
MNVLMKLFKNGSHSDAFHDLHSGHIPIVHLLLGVGREKDFAAVFCQTA